MTDLAALRRYAKMKMVEEISEKEWLLIGKRYDKIFKREERKFSQKERVERYDKVFDLVVKELAAIGKIEVDDKIVFPDGTVTRRPGMQRIPGRETTIEERQIALRKSREDIQFIMSRWVDMSREITIIPHIAEFEETMKAIEVLSPLLASLDRAFHVTFDSIMAYIGLENSGRVTAFSPHPGRVADYVSTDWLIPLRKA